MKILGIGTDIVNIDRLAKNFKKDSSKFKNKILIYSAIAIIVISFASINFYLSSKEEKNILIAENYINAKIQIQNENKVEAIKILKEIIYLDDSTYSTLSLFLLLSENLISDNQEILSLFDHVLHNNKYKKEIKNSIIFKKVLFQTNSENEQELLSSIKPLINSDSIWKPHTLLLVGDYFFSRNEYLNSDARLNAEIIFKTLQLRMELINSHEKNISNIYDMLIEKISSRPSISIGRSDSISSGSSLISFCRRACSS